MAITNYEAVAYSDENARIAANLIAQSYRKLKLLSQQWSAANGNNAQKWVTFQESIRKTADEVIDSYYVVLRINHQWYSLGMNNLFPNSNAELVYDNPDRTGQDPYRPAITGQDVQRLQSRWREWLAWLERNTFDPNATPLADFNASNLYAFGKLARETRNPGQNAGVAVATTLAQAIITQYEVTQPSHLTHILTVAVNP